MDFKAIQPFEFEELGPATRKREPGAHGRLHHVCLRKKNRSPGQASGAQTPRDWGPRVARGAI